MASLDLVRSSPEARKRPPRSKAHERFMYWEEVSEREIFARKLIILRKVSLLVQPCDIVSQDVVDINGLSLYPTINSIKEVKCLIGDVIASCFTEFRGLCPERLTLIVDCTLKYGRNTGNWPALLWWSQEEFEQNVWDQASLWSFACWPFRVGNRQLPHSEGWIFCLQ